jgi:glycosyltransferase involved in cell wall biosynthesis
VKILHVIPSFYPALVYGGPPVSVYHLSAGLGRLGCAVRVLTTDANGADSVLDVDTTRDIELAAGLRVRYCHRVADVSVSPALLRLLPSYVRDADLIHLTAVYSFPTIPTLALCRLMNKPVVWSPRGMLQRWDGSTHTLFKTVWERICRAIASRKMILHWTSDEEARESKPRMPGFEAVVIANGIEIPEAMEHTENSGQLRLAFLGRIHPKKGIENLLKGLVSLNGAVDSVMLTIAGDGDPAYLQTLRQLTATLALASRVRFIGAVSGSEKERFFANADVVVVPSHTENFALVVAEALAHAVPVIASTGTPWRRINDVGCGLWTGNTPQELAAAIRQISSMPLRLMAQRGREWMVRDFSWDPIARQMLRVYESSVRCQPLVQPSLEGPC